MEKVEELERKLSEQTEKFRRKLKEVTGIFPFAPIYLPDPKLKEEICRGKECKGNHVISFDDEALETIDMIVPQYNPHYLNVKDNPQLKAGLFELCNDCRKHPICKSAIIYLNPSNLILLNSMQKIYAKWVWMLWEEFDKINRQNAFE